MKTVAAGPGIPTGQPCLWWDMRNRLTKLLWVLVPAYFALVAWAAFTLPERVPMHWTGTAGPDQWGSRTSAVIMLTGLGLIIVAIFGTLLVTLPRSRSLTWVNLPNQAYWQRPENLPRAVDMVAADSQNRPTVGIPGEPCFPLKMVTGTRDPVDLGSPVQVGAVGSAR